jgi:hypothetical protein
MRESMIVPMPYLHLGIGLVTALLAIGLIARRVPMNHVVGFRVRKPFVSVDKWYEIDAYGRKLFLAFGVFLLACGFLGQDFALLLAFVPFVIVANLFARRLPEG